MPGGRRSIDNIISIVARGPLLLFDFGTIALDGKFPLFKGKGRFRDLANFELMKFLYRWRDS